jgi:predicted amino acid racemase
VDLKLCMGVSTEFSCYGCVPPTDSSAHFNEIRDIRAAGEGIP